MRNDDFNHVQKEAYFVSFGLLDHIIYVDVNLIEVNVEMDYQRCGLSPCQTNIEANLSKP